MWCPKCGAEFVKGVMICPECNVELVDQPVQKEVEYMPKNWKIASRFSDKVSATLAEGLLKDNNIDCRIEDLSFSAGPVPVSTNINNIRLWVKSEDYDSAINLLEDTKNEN